MLTPEQVGWIAGFIDGEGSLGIYFERDLRKGPDYTRPRPMLQVTNTDIRAILHLRSLVGAGVAMKVRDARKPGYRDLWRFHLRRHHELRDLLRTIEPHLTVKGDVARLVLAYCELRLAHNGRGRNAPFSDRELQIISALRAA